MINSRSNIERQLNNCVTTYNSKICLAQSQVNGFVDVMLNPTNLSAIFKDWETWLGNMMYYPCVPPYKIDYTNNTIHDGIVRFDGTETSARGIVFDTKHNYFHIGELYYTPKYNNFVDYNGYTKLELFLPYFGFIELNPNDVINKYIQIRLLVDYNSGSATYIIGVTDISIPWQQTGDRYVAIDDDNFDFKIISTVVFQLGMAIPIGTTNNAEIAQNLILNSVKTVGGIASGIAISNLTPPSTSTYSGTTTKSIVDTKRNPKTNRQIINKTSTASTTHTSQRTVQSSPYGINNVISEVYSNSIDALAHFKNSAHLDKSNNTALNFATSIYPYLKRYTPKIKSVGTDYDHLFGKPLGEVRILSSLQGYTEVSKIHFEGEAFGTCTVEEYKMIEDAFSSGVIL